MSCELRAVLSYFEKRNKKDFFADYFDAALIRHVAWTVGPDGSGMDSRDGSRPNC